MDGPLPPIDPRRQATPKYAARPDDPKAHHLPNTNGFLGLGRWFGPRFQNPWDSFYGYTPLQFLKMLREYDRAQAAVPDPLPVKVIMKDQMDFNRIDHPPADKLQITWLGHASFLLQVDGKRILCDPICSYRCSPFASVGPARYTPPPLTFQELADLKVDAVIISHNHYDHLDFETLKALGPDVTYFVPLGNKEWFASLKYPHMYECDWWDRHQFKDLDIICTPCQHFTGRGLTDRYRTLWSSWVVKSEKINQRFFFGGDTGYRHVPNGCDEEDMPCCPAFVDIGEKYGPFDLAW